MLQPHCIIEYAKPLIVRETLKSLYAEREKLLTQAQNLEAAATFIAILKEGAPANAWVNINRYMPDQVHITFPVSGFTSEASPTLFNFLEFVGMYFDDEPTSIDMPQYAKRLYTFHAGEAELLDVVVTAELVEGDGLCQRVITGTRKAKQFVYIDIDEPIYAFKC